MSLPAWGEWIEISLLVSGYGRILSLPAWGEWIEIVLSLCLVDLALSLSPHGESGLKLLSERKHHSISGRLSPHGESGLKLKDVADIKAQLESLPAWGEWIEICQLSSGCVFAPVSPRMGRVD